MKKNATRPVPTPKAPFLPDLASVVGGGDEPAATLLPGPQLKPEEIQ